jgi:Spy/CpxP family protein refolding chaperone
VGRWWDEKTVVRAVGLGKAQQKQMDATFNADKPGILSSYKTFLNEQAKLNALSKDPNADKERLFAAIDAVNQARAALQKATTQMQLQIRQQMSPDQIQKLEKLR